jgi:hypothetical protein
VRTLIADFLNARIGQEFDLRTNAITNEVFIRTVSGDELVISKLASARETSSNGNNTTARAYLVTTNVNGVEVVLTQENSLASPNTFTTTAIEVDGQGAVSMEAFAEFIDGRCADPMDLKRAATHAPAYLRGVVTTAVTDTPWVNSYLNLRGAIAREDGLATFQAGMGLTRSECANDESSYELAA